MDRRRIARELMSVARAILATDFSHGRLVSQMWREKVREAMERQGIHFDLENNDSTGDPQVVKAGEYEYVDGEMLPYRFVVQTCKAGGDWENPVLYYRVQVHPKSHKPLVKLFKFDEDNTFVYIPVDGNSNLQDTERENEDGTKKTVLAPTSHGDEEGVDIDEKACKEDLLAFLEKMVALKLGPEAGWEDEPELEFKGGRLVTASEYPTFMELHEQAAKTGDHHHLRLHCVKCGNVETCRCSAPKVDKKGICYYCTTGEER